MSIPSTGLGVAWLRELGLLLLWLTIWGVTGFLIQHFLAAMLTGVSLYLALHMAYTYKLHGWVTSGKHQPPPDGSGVWQEIFLEFYNLNQRSRQRKKRLANIVNEFRASTAALPDGAVVLDRLLRIVWFNDAAVDLLGLRSPNDVGQPIGNLVRHPKFIEYLADSPHIKQVEIATDGDDRVILALRIIPYGDGQRLLIARDISQQSRLDAMRRDFVANASHELRTPLTVLRGYLEMMQEEGGGGQALARWQKPIKDMEQQALRMGRIIEDLLTLARVEGGGQHEKQAVLHVPELLQRLLANAHKSDVKNRQIDTDIDTDLFLFGRSGELESIFSNLLTNAMQYTSEGGTIQLRWWQDEEGAHYCVSDSGIGIEAKHIPRLTERFYRADPGRSSASGGTGLGLAIVKHCLEHHDAQLQIVSELNVGSRFTCNFPRERAHQRDAGPLAG